jgi:hypothetical protein
MAENKLNRGAPVARSAGFTTEIEVGRNERPPYKSKIKD